MESGNAGRMKEEHNFQHCKQNLGHNITDRSHGEHPGSGTGVLKTSTAENVTRADE